MLCTATENHLNELEVAMFISARAFAAALNLEIVVSEKMGATPGPPIAPRYNIACTILLEVQSPLTLARMSAKFSSLGSRRMHNCVLAG